MEANNTYQRGGMREGEETRQWDMSAVGRTGILISGSP